MDKPDRLVHRPFVQVAEALTRELREQREGPGPSTARGAAAGPARERDAAAPPASRAAAPPASAAPAPPASAAPSPPAAASDRRYFLEQMRGVVPLERDNLVLSQSPPPVPSARDDDAEALAELADLVEGRAEFDIEDTDEYIEGIAHGIDRRLLRKLRKGLFATQAHLDLHGRNRQEAREAVEQLLYQSRQRGHRCVLVIHGRGLNSKDQIPVLKESLRTWLVRGRFARRVLAFCTARPTDGGAGAIYVLLRR